MVPILSHVDLLTAIHPISFEVLLAFLLYSTHDVIRGYRISLVQAGLILIKLSFPFLILVNPGVIASNLGCTVVVFNNIILNYPVLSYPLQIVKKV